jgi:hypothetical protein
MRFNLLVRTQNQFCRLWESQPQVGYRKAASQQDTQCLYLNRVQVFSPHPGQKFPQEFDTRV